MNFKYVLSESSKERIKYLQDLIFKIKKEYLSGQNKATTYVSESELQKKFITDVRVVNAKKEIAEIYETSLPQIFMSNDEYEKFIKNVEK